MAKNNRLVMREEELETLTKGLDKCSASVGASSQSLASKFSNVTGAGMMTGIVGPINSQLNAISNSMTNVRNIVTKHTNQMFDLDRNFAQQASTIEIPQDFLANDSSEINMYNRTILGKIDGRSVNEGETATAFNDIDESSITAEGLENITGQQATEEHYDASSVIGTSVLTNINKNETQAQEYKDGTENVTKSELGNINKNSTTQQQELDSSTTIATVGLSEVPNNGTGPDAGKAYDEVMAETQGLASTAFASMVSSQNSSTKKNDDEENN